MPAAGRAATGSRTGPHGLQGHMIPLPTEEPDRAVHFLPALLSVVQMPGSFGPRGDMNEAHRKQILIHSSRDLSLSVVFADLPLTLFSAPGGKCFLLLEKGHECLLCWFVFMSVWSGL